MAARPTQIEVVGYGEKAGCEDDRTGLLQCVNQLNPAGSIRSTHTCRPECSIAAVDGKVFVTGGSHSNLVDIFNVETGIWRRGPPLLERRNCHASAVTTGQQRRLLVVCGGEHDVENELHRLHSVEVLNTSAIDDGWHRLPNDLESVGGAGCAAVCLPGRQRRRRRRGSGVDQEKDDDDEDDLLIVSAGSESWTGAEMTRLSRRRCLPNDAESGWRPLADMNKAHQDHGMVALPDDADGDFHRVVVAGGYCTSVEILLLSKKDAATDRGQWTLLAPLSESQGLWYDCTYLFVTDDRLFVFNRHHTVVDELKPPEGSQQNLANTSQVDELQRFTWTPSFEPTEWGFLIGFVVVTWR